MNEKAGIICHSNRELSEDFYLNEIVLEGELKQDSCNSSKVTLPVVFRMFLFIKEFCRTVLGLRS